MTQEPPKRGRPQKSDPNILPTASKAMEIATPSDKPNAIDIGGSLRDILEMRKMETQMKALDTVNNYLDKETPDSQSTQLHAPPRVPGQAPTPEQKQPPLIEAMRLLPEDQRQELLNSLLKDESNKDYLYTILGGNSQASLPTRQRPTPKPGSELGEQTNALLTLAEVAGLTQTNKSNGELNSINIMLAMNKLIRDMTPPPAPAPTTDPAMAAALNSIANVLGTVVQANKETQLLLQTLPEKIKPPADNSNKELLELVMNHSKELAAEREARYNERIESEKKEAAAREKYYQDTLNQLKETIKPAMDNREGIDRLALEVRRRLEDSGAVTKEDRELAIEKIKADVEKSKIAADLEIRKMNITANDNVQKESKQKWNALEKMATQVLTAVTEPGLSNALKNGGTPQASSIIGAGR
jgi:hypothetical protein